ncbi:MAG TPA: penicillin-binding transpeptidase domain-containing protein [Acidimicrobiales bacterium]|nr:penicillin-binding transpeptidase domain-containing protein [Acidimicrobiales bacterium]
MDKRIRILALFLVACFVLLFLQLNNLQVRQASALQHSPLTPSAAGVSFYRQYRGEIISSDGYVLAKSVKTANGYMRVYPQGQLFAGITGYWDIVDESGLYGLEDEYGGTPGQPLTEHQISTPGLNGLLTQHQGTDSITITVSRKLQIVAQQALAAYSRGAVVAIDPQTGNLLAMYSKPSYDPNLLSSPKPSVVRAALKALNPTSGTSPLVNLVTESPSAPGSTFKIITTSAVFDHKPSVALKVWPPRPFISLPQTTSLLHNYASEVCGGNIATALAISCDTAYAQIGIALGARHLATEAHAFGLNQVPPLDLPNVEASQFPPLSQLLGAPPFVAYSAIGQFDVKETPLQDALVAAAIGNGGTIMAPHLLAHVIDDQGNIVKTFKPHAWLQATSASTANEVRLLMRGVVTGGTATGVGFPPALGVAAKTGTAETGSTGCSANWFVATAPAGNGQTPKVAVAAYVPYQPGLSCSETGAEAAGPVVRQVLEAALGYGG